MKMFPNNRNINHRNTIRFSRLLTLMLLSLVALALLTYSLGLAQAKRPITKKGLLEAVQINGLTTKELVARIQQRGVDFELTSGDEADFRRAGARPEIISAARENYRPAVAVNAPTRPPASNNNTPPVNNANTARLANVPDGPPLARNEIVTLLQSGVPPARVEQFVEKRGVSFSVTPEIAREITAAGGTRSLVGAITEKSTEETFASNKPSPPTGNTRDEGPDYDDLTDRAVASMKANDFNSAVRYLQQAVTLDASKPTAYQLLGINMLYAQQNISAASQAMHAAIDRGGAAVFRVYHDHDGAFGTYCTGSFFVTKTGVSFKADDGNDTFEAEDSNIKEAKINTFMGAAVAAFHIKPKVKINGRDNFNFAPATKQKAESQLLISMIQSY